MDSIAGYFEAGMLILFGCSWPVAIAKTLRVRKVHGQSLIFLYLVCIGYLCGLTAKFIRAHGSLPDWVTILYAVNAVMVAIGIILHYRFRQPPDAPGADIQPESPGVEITDDERRPAV